MHTEIKYTRTQLTLVFYTGEDVTSAASFAQISCTSPLASGGRHSQWTLMGMGSPDTRTRIERRRETVILKEARRKCSDHHLWVWTRALHLVLVRVWGSRYTGILFVWMYIADLLKTLHGTCISIISEIVSYELYGKYCKILYLV